MLTLDEAKQYLRLDTDSEDEYLRILILAVRVKCVKIIRVWNCRSLCRKAINRLC